MSRSGGPESIVEAFARAYRAKRYDEIYDLYAGDSEIRKTFTKESYSSRMRSTTLRTKMEIQEARIAGSYVMGDTARVVLSSTTRSIVGDWHLEEEFDLKREAGNWRIANILKLRQWPLKQGGVSVRGGK